MNAVIPSPGSPGAILNRATVAVHAAGRPGRLVGSGVVCIIALLALVAAWGALAPVSGAVIGAGQVKVDMNRKTVQHPDGGVVAEILVRDGSRVKAGETLLVLGDARVGADAQMLRGQLDAEVARHARFAAEESGALTLNVPAELASRIDEPSVAELLARERAIFSARQQALRAQLRLLQVQIGEIRVELDARRAQVAADESALEYQRQELEIHQSLAERGFVSKVRLTALQREMATHESRRAQNLAELSRSQQKVSELELRAETVRAQFRQEASIGVLHAMTQVVDLRERLRPALEAELRQRIVAPIGGEVVGLKVTSVGAVIGPRDQILDIVPEEPDLVVEARLRPEDISHVQYDSPVQVRLTGLRQRLTPTVEGRLTHVSADRLTDTVSQAPFYLAQVRVSSDELERLGNARLQPGMPAEIYIQTASRTAVEYLLDPILGFLNRSMREQ
jgi:membrane fusion protein, epimerase transport system